LAKSGLHTKGKDEILYGRELWLAKKPSQRQGTVTPAYGKEKNGGVDPRAKEAGPQLPDDGSDATTRKKKNVESGENVRRKGERGGINK